MIYRINVLSFSLLLGAGGVANSVVDSLSCRDQCEVIRKTPEDFHVTPQLKPRAIFRQRSRYRRNVTQRVSGSILGDLTSFQDDAQDNASDKLDSEVPESPAGINLNDPIGSVTGWLNHEGRVYNTLGLEGGLDIIAPSDEKPMGVKVGALGFASDSSIHSPFELLPETKAGAAVYLTLAEPVTDQAKEILNPGASFSNNSMATLMARSEPLGLDLLSSVNLTRVGSTSGASELASLMHVLIKVGPPSSNSNPGTLCATFYLRSAWSYTDDDAPMFLERCNTSLTLGRSTGPANSTATQLWQYDPKTHELKPIIRSDPKMSSEGIPSNRLSSTSPVTSGTIEVDKDSMPPQPSSFSVKGTRTIITQSSVTAQQTYGHTYGGATPTHSSKNATPSQVKIRRENGRIGANEPVAPSFTAVTIVEPYTLVFAPRTSAGDGAMLPGSPV